MIFMLGYMSGNVVSHRCHSQVLPYVKLLLQSLRRAELWYTAWHALRGKSRVCHFFSFSMDFYGNMAADVRAWWNQESSSALLSSQFSLRAWPISLVPGQDPASRVPLQGPGGGNGCTAGSTLDAGGCLARCIALCRIDTTIWNVASMLAVFSTGNSVLPSGKLT